MLAFLQFAIFLTTTFLNILHTISIAFPYSIAFRHFRYSTPTMSDPENDYLLGEPLVIIPTKGIEDRSASDESNTTEGGWDSVLRLPTTMAGQRRGAKLRVRSLPKGFVFQSTVGDLVIVAEHRKEACDVYNIRQDREDTVPWDAFFEVAVGFECRCEPDNCPCYKDDPEAYVVSPFEVRRNLADMLIIILHHRPGKNVLLSRELKQSNYQTPFSLTLRPLKGKDLVRSW